MYIRELPTPLIPTELYPGLLDPADYADIQTACELIRQNILARMPHQNYLLLRKLMALLHAVAIQESVNRMGPKNLSICWTPNLILHEGLEEQMRYMKTSQATIALMISEYDQIFRQ